MLIVIKEKDNVFVAGSIADDCVMPTLRDLTCDDNINVWKVRSSGCVVGVTEPCRAADILKYSDYFKNKVNADTLLRDIAPQMEQDFKEWGLTDGEGAWSQCVVVAYGNEAFEISSVFNIVPIRDFMAVGYGSEIAEGSLERTKDLPAKERIAAAVRAIEQAFLVRAFPVVIIDTKNGKREIVKK